MNQKIKIIDLDKNEYDLNPKVIALGNFDGLHLGHMSLMKKNLEISNEYHLEPSVLLFKENTKKLLYKNKKNFLTNLSDKINKLVKYGIKTFIIVTFDEKFSSKSKDEFIRDYLVDKLNAKYIVVGKDYRFGLKASGDVSYLKEKSEFYGYKVCDVELKNLYGKKINSTYIKSLISLGDIDKANKELGYYYSIKGEVVDGEKRGRVLGFPTANLKLNFNYVLPKEGLYYTNVYIDNEKFSSLTDIGKNPTFENDEIKIETYILDFNKNIYGKEITIEFIKFLRSDIKFNKVNDLILQMKIDVDTVKKLSNNNKKISYL